MKIKPNNSKTTDEMRPKSTKEMLHFSCFYCHRPAPYYGIGTIEVTEHLGMTKVGLTSEVRRFCSHACHVADAKGEYSEEIIRSRDIEQIKLRISQYEMQLMQLQTSEKLTRKKIREVAIVMKTKLKELKKLEKIGK